MSMRPLAVNVAGDGWRVELQRGAWQVPFSIELNKFTRELLSAVAA